MKKFSFIALLLGSFILWSCDSRQPALPDSNIVIMFENDVHCGVDGYAKFVARRSEYAAHTPYVTTVSNGDFVQGDVIGSVSKGESIVNIMNAARYDIVTLGNHEFDYGMARMHEITDELDAKVVDCNFVELPSRRQVFDPFTIVNYGGVKVAYIGFTTPNTFNSTSPKTFQDAEGNYAYDFSSEGLNELAQQQINKARGHGADYVVALSHLGDEMETDSNTSVSLIAGTIGLDAVLDGHCHNVIIDSMVLNLKGEPVLLASTGTKFQYLAALIIDTLGTLHTEFVKTEDYQQTDQAVLEVVEREKEAALASGRRIVGNTPFTLQANDGAIRLTRISEMPVGNFVADAVRTMTGAQIAVINGGGVRVDINKGDVSFNDLMAVTPFGNICCLATISGQQLLDALEFSLSFFPAADGAFPQVSGIRFDVNPKVNAAFRTDSNGIFEAVEEGSPRRISNLQVLEAGEYRPVETERDYTIASFDFMFKNMGSSGMFRYVKLLPDPGISDVDATSSYLETVLGGKMPELYSRPDGRINIR